MKNKTHLFLYVENGIKSDITCISYNYLADIFQNIKYSKYLINNSYGIIFDFAYLLKGNIKLVITFQLMGYVNKFYLLRQKR